MAGWESNGAVPVARLWRDGRVQELSGGLRGSLATGVAISGQDVYVSGALNDGAFDVAVYWKNGEPVALTDGSAQAFAEAIAVSGGDVYVAGYQYYGGKAVATVWKNDSPTALTDGTFSAVAFAVAVSGSDTFVAGWEDGVTEVAPGDFVMTNIAKIWKNGIPIALSDGREHARASAIVVEGSDVYAAGRVGRGGVFVATVWKNGVPLSLTDGVYGAVATGIAMNGDEVLVSGGEHDGSVDVAKVWREGVPVDLTSADRQGTAQPAIAEAIAVAGADVYAAGYHGRAAVYWKNGARVALTSGSYNADARAIAVVVR